MVPVVVAFATLLLVFLGFPVLAAFLKNWFRFGKPLRLQCPVYHAPGEVRVARFLAAFTSIYGPPRLRLKSCTLLPSGTMCVGACLRGSSVLQASA